MGKRWATQCKKLALEYAELSGSDAKSYRWLEVPKSTFYQWKKAYAMAGEAGLIGKKPVAKSHPRQLPSEVVEKVIHLRQTYHFGPQRIMWYLQR